MADGMPVFLAEDINAAPGLLADRSMPASDLGNERAQCDIEEQHCCHTGSYGQWDVMAWWALFSEGDDVLRVD